MGEWMIYGSDRLGTKSWDSLLHRFTCKGGFDPEGDFVTLERFDTLKAKQASPMYTRKRGTRNYELKNHLGNVLVTVTDRKIPNNTDGDTLTDYYTADVVTAQDYYPFGMMQPGRKYEADSTDGYRCGFNGQEKDDDLY